MSDVPKILSLHLLKSIQMLENIVTTCPNDLWHGQSESKSISKRLLHTLESIDYWFDDFSEYHFSKLFKGMSPEMDIDNGMLVNKESMIKYLEIIKSKAIEYFNEIASIDISRNSGKHSNITILDIVLCQIRHVQINVGYCSEKYCNQGLKGIEWLGHNEG